MKRILSLALSTTAVLAFMAPVAAHAQAPTPTPKFSKGAGGPPPGAARPAVQPQFVKPVVHATPPPARPAVQPQFVKPVVHATPPPTRPVVQPQFVKPVVHATPPPKVSAKPFVKPQVVNNTNPVVSNPAATGPKFKKGGTGKPSGAAPVVNNTTFVHNTPTVVQSKTFAGPKGGGGGKYTRANNYGGRWVGADSHSDWKRGQVNVWQGHHYRWFNGGWLMIDGGFWPAGYYTYQTGGSKMYNAQAQLANMGYYNGEVDGIAGPETRQAIANYQADNDLPVDGHLNPPTQDSLGLDQD